jgi:hypothetical protein
VLGVTRAETASCSSCGKPAVVFAVGVWLTFDRAHALNETMSNTWNTLSRVQTMSLGR